MGLFSCRKQKYGQYEFVVKNNTTYNIDSFEFSCSANNTQISLAPKSASSPFSLTLRKTTSFVEAVLCLGVNKYSDSISTYENTVSAAIPLSKLMEDKPNIIKIEMDTNPNFPTDIFDVSVNQ